MCCYVINCPEFACEDVSMYDDSYCESNDFGFV